GFKFTGSDFFIDKNVFGIVLEVPNSALGSNSHVGIWASNLLPINGELVQVDRMGRPAINTVFNHGNDKNVFNSVPPTQDRTLFTNNVVSTLETLGGYTSSEAAAIAQILLPDILTYDYSSATGFLNGRQLTDDVIDLELNLITHGAITGDGAGPHT